MPLKLSDLVAATDLADTDIMHLRTIGAVDKKITGANLKIAVNPLHLFDKYIFDNYAEDLELDGTPITQRIIYCKDLDVTANTTLKARCVYVDGDLTIDGGVTLTIDPLETSQISRNFLMVTGGKGVAGGGSAGGGFGGVTSATEAVKGSGGGGGFGGAGGNSQAGGIGGASAGGGLGGAGGAAVGAAGAAGGGGGFGGAGGSSSGAGQGGDGGELIFFIVRGNFVNNGTITNSGVGGAATGNGGGGGGAVIIAAFGNSPTVGTINCNGGAGQGTYGGGGGGGHIEIYARTASFGTLNVDGGTAGGEGEAGSAGTTKTINISSDKLSAVGGEDTDVASGRLFRFLEKAL